MTTVSTTGTWTGVSANLPSLSGVSTQHVGWGIPFLPQNPQNKQSGYRFEGRTVPAALDGSEFVLGTFTHDNFVTQGGYQLEFDVHLKVNVAFENGILNRELNLTFAHKETPNVGGQIPDEVSLPTFKSPESVVIDGEEYNVVICGFRQGPAIVTKFISAEGSANSADIIAKLEKVVKPRPDVVITDIRYKGEVKRVQSDEYIEIMNRGTAPGDISGFEIYADDSGQNFKFPAGTVLQPGQKIRVYTNEVHPEWGGFSYGINRAIWNDKGDVAHIRDPKGESFASYGYGEKALKP